MLMSWGKRKEDEEVKKKQVSGVKKTEMGRIMQHGYRYTPSDPNVTLENNKRVKNYYREELSAFTNTNAHYLFLFLMLSKTA